MSKFYFFSKRFSVFFRPLLLFLSILFLGVGCISFKSNAIDGGVFVSPDSGATWQNRSLIPTVTGQPGSFAGQNVLSLVIDPVDPQVIYAGTGEEGLFFSFNRGATWHKANLNYARVDAIAIDPKDPCNVFIASNNRIGKSGTCGRSWSEVYADPRGGERITALAVDGFINNRIYAATVSGDILQSTDFGNSWKVIHRIGDEVREMLIYPKDTRVVYAATVRSGIWKSDDAGATWTLLKEGLQQFGGALDFRDMTFDATHDQTIIHASQFGLLISQDGGITWKEIPILTPPGAVFISSLAVNPKDPREILYSVDGTFYRTVDGGKNWVTKKMPTARRATSIRIDPMNTSVVYLAGVTVKK